MKKLAEISVLAALVLWVSAYLAAPYFSSGFWFLMDAAAKVCLSGAVAIVMTGYLARTIAVSLFILSISNLLDELFFDPQVTSNNEYLFGAIVLIYTIFKILYGKPE